MTAWVSPSRMVRSTPRRICFVPWSVSTLTWRSAMESVDMLKVLYLVAPPSGGQFLGGDRGGVDEHVAALDHDPEDGHRLVGRQGERASARQGELRAVRPALQRLVLDEALGERDVAVGAGVADGVDGAVRVLHDGDGRPGDVDAEGGVDLEVVDRADADAGHRGSPASSASIASCRRVSSSGTPIFC